MIAPPTTATTVVTRTSCGAAACSMVRPGRKRGSCASAQPATIAATATAAV